MKYRSPIAVFLLPFATLGIYAVYWLVRTKTEMNARGEDIPTAWLFVVPIVNLYWLYRFSQGVDHVTNGTMSTGAAFLFAFFLSTIGYAVIQSSLNGVAS
jgi:hypothetical protein